MFSAGCTMNTGSKKLQREVGSTFCGAHRGFDPEIPRDASWGERYFHMPDPDGHELSFARPLR